MVRIKALLALALVAFLVLTTFNLGFNVIGGTIDNPDLVDSEGDSVSGKTSRDILWGFMGYETNSTFAVVIGLKSLETFSDPSQISSLPVTSYEFYFTIKGVNYGAVATVPVHGPFGIDIRYELMTVEYNGSTPSKETSKATISTGRYDTTHSLINMTIPKSDVGGVAQGDKATNLWCAVYSKQRSSGINFTTPVLEDRAPDSGYGTEFMFVGSPEAKVVRLELSSDAKKAQNVTVLVPVKFEMSVYNNGTDAVQVGMRNSTVSGGKFNISFSPLSVTVEPGSSANVTMVVKIKDIRNTKDGDIIIVSAWAETNIGNDTAPKMKTSNYLTFTITASIPATPIVKKTGWAKTLEDMTKFVRDNKNPLMITIVLLIVLVIGVVVYVKVRGGKKEEFEDLEVKVKRPPEEEEEEEDEEEENEEEDED